jgi:gamma-glutamyltranspeptidase/glutathione hydrolase
MTPTFLLGADRVAVLGSPGGSRIITRVLLALLDLVDGADAKTAVTAPRFHHQYLPDKVYAEAGAFTPEEIAQLGARGYSVVDNEKPWGNMQVVVWDKSARRVEAASDPRGMGVGKGGVSAENNILR